MTSGGTGLVAHGIAVRQDLPIPFSYALVGSAVALIVSFVALGVLWHKPRLEDHTGGLLVPAGAARFLDSPAFRWALRVLGLAVTALVVAAAAIGPDTSLNPAAYVVYVLFWLGTLVIASVLLGPVWRALNPLRTLHLLLARATGSDPAVGVLRYPRWLGCWPAAATLLAFAWLELVAANRASTSVLLTFFALYAAVMLVGATVFGSTFFDEADGFERYSTTLGKLSVLGRRDGDRAPVLRNPLTNLTTMPQGIGVPAFVSVMLAITAFDAYSNSTQFIRWSQQGSLAPTTAGTIGLVGTSLVVLVAFGAASAVAGRLGGRPWHAMPSAFAHSLVPIALGYVVAHYYSYFLIGGQDGLARLSDPFQNGSDYLGLTDRDPSFLLVTPTTVAVIQVVAVVTGHVLGVVSAHDRAIALFPRGRALLGQIPLLVVMVVFTVTGLALLFEG